MVIKNVPFSLTNDEIRDKLKELKYSINKVTRLLNKYREPTQTVALELTDNDAAKEIFKLAKLEHSMVTVEPRRGSQNIPTDARDTVTIKTTARWSSDA